MPQLSKEEPVVVLVTGCTKGGIGYGLCQAFLEKGCTVFASARRVEAMSGLEELGAHLLQLDVTSAESCKAAVEALLKDPASGGKIDILVNNAGAGGTGALLDFDVDDAKRTFDVNFFGVMRLTQLVAPNMAARRSGLIINIGSIVGNVTTPWAAIYCSTKSALHAMTTALTMEVKGLGINVMLVTPGSITSGFGDRQEASIKVPENSLYKNMVTTMQHRAQAGQRDAISNIEFARQVVAQALMKPPPTYFSAGGNAWKFWALSWLPRWLQMQLVGKPLGVDLVGTGKAS